MATLYALTYPGVVGAGAGALYVGNVALAGFDIYGGRYKGTYTETGGRFKVSASMDLPEGGELVTGEQLPPGTTVTIAADWPLNFANGQPQTLMVHNKPVQVILARMIDF